MHENKKKNRLWKTDQYLILIKPNIYMDDKINNTDETHLFHQSIIYKIDHGPKSTENYCAKSMDHHLVSLAS